MLMNDSPMQAYSSPSSYITPTTMGLDRSPDLYDAHYLSELMNDRAVLESLPKRFKHVERVLDQEIVNVRERLFDTSFGVKMQLPLPFGEPRVHRKKVYIPETGPHFNFVGRLLGPGGKTLKSIEQDTGCKVMIRGVGSSRPFLPPSAMYGQSSACNAYGFMSPQSPYENEPLHVILQCHDTANRADVRIGTALQLIENLFAPVDSANDVLKQKQLLELSILRGTFKSTPSLQQQQRRSNVDLFQSGVFFTASPQNV